MQVYSRSFPMSVNPVHIGWYQTKNPHESWHYYNYWDGEMWCVSVNNLHDEKTMNDAIARKSTFICNNFHNMVWRGIQKD